MRSELLASRASITASRSGLLRAGVYLGVIVALGAGCATLAGVGKGASGTATGDQLQARNKALGELLITALKPCEAKLKVTDSGLMLVTAKPDGSVALGPMQWSGSEEMKACIQAETPKAKLPAWPGPSVTWMWPVGTKDSPPPKSVDAPASYEQKQGDLLRAAQGVANQADLTTGGPVSACVQRALPPDAYARVTLRLFVFPDGQVAGVTPWDNDGEGKDAQFQECLSDIPKAWKFEPFQGTGYVVVDTTMNAGIKQ